MIRSVGELRMEFTIKSVVIIYNVCIFQTSCDDNTGGPANGVNIFNVKCEMNHNFANQYIFLILWFWYIFLFVIGRLVSALLPRKEHINREFGNGG